MRDPKVERLLSEISQISPAAGRKAEELATSADDARHKAFEELHKIMLREFPGAPEDLRLDDLMSFVGEQYRTMRGQIETQAANLEAVEQREQNYQGALNEVRSLHQQYFAGTEYGAEPGTRFIGWMAKVYEVASQLMAKDVVERESAPKSATIEQLESMYNQVNEALGEMTEVAAQRGQKLEEALRSVLTEKARGDRLQLAFVQEETRRKQERARGDAIVLAATEEGVESPAKYDFAWSPGLDVILQLRRVSAMRLDGWQRFEREAGRLELENGLLKGRLEAAEERNRELSGFLESAGLPERAPLSEESDVAPGQDSTAIPAESYCKDPSCTDAPDGPHVHFETGNMVRNEG
jgi:hypothetical protein